jgi:indolepyruvate ferredoxin oxidoreductase, beta subunit
MKTDVILAGVGGQGILTIAAVLGRAALAQGLHLKQAEVHGMAQRGGAVQSHFRMADEPIHADVVPRGRADMILAMEPMEALRYTGWLKPGGRLISNSRPVLNLSDYPPEEDLRAAFDAIPDSLLFDGSAIAEEEGASRALNMAMLGAASPFLPIAEEAIQAAMASYFQGKGDRVLEANRRVFKRARDAASKG